MADELERLFRALVLRIRDTRPENLSRAFEVVDIQRTLVPYRATRGDVGVDTAEEYELLLLRLLSGERGYMFTDEVMQDDIRRELASGNPDLTTLQAYGTAKVTLAQQALRLVLEAEPPQGSPAVAEVPPVAAAKPRPSFQTNVSRIPDPTVETPARAPRPGCRFCGQPLPEGRDVTFCAHCGQNPKVRRCPGCSSDLEPGWKFCVTCGRAAE